MVSVYSIIWTIFNCSLMAFILMILRRNTAFLQKYGTSILIFLTICCTARMIFPVEFPEHQFILNDKIFLTKIQGSYEHYLHLLSYKPLILGIWATGTGVFILAYITHYLVIQTRIHSNACLAETHVRDILRQIDPACPMDVYISPDISVPVTAGLLRPNIYITEYPYNETDLHYIILHEYNHWRRKDIRKKAILYLLSSMMWWNPFFYLLRNEFIQLLEFKCDYTLSKDFSTEEVTSYLESLYHTQAFLEKNRKRLKTSSTTMEFVGTKRSTQSTIKQRFALLIYGQDKGHGVVKVILVLIILLWVAASYYFLPQPYYTPFTTETNELIIPDEICIEETENKNYYLYYKDTTVLLDENNLNNCNYYYYTKKYNHNSIIKKIIKTIYNFIYYIDN